MRGALGYYLNLVDTSAFNDADTAISANSAPFLPLALPATIGGLVGYLISDRHPTWIFAIIVVTVAVSITSYGGCAIYYYRAVARHRKDLGLPDWRQRIRERAGGN